MVPILGFFFLYATQERFRRYVLSLDLRFLTIVHACRTVGFAFVLLHMRDALPGLFAWPAGLRDIAVAITAPGILFALLKSPGFATRNRFICWHVLGLVDFVAAVGTDVLSSGAFATLYQPTVKSSPVAEMPLVRIPLLRPTSSHHAFRRHLQSVEVTVRTTGRSLGRRPWLRINGVGEPCLTAPNAVGRVQP